jgi:hypothetical protein
MFSTDPRNHGLGATVWNGKGMGSRKKDFPGTTT